MALSLLARKVSGRIVYYRKLIDGSCTFFHHMFTNGRPPFVIVLEGRERRQMDLSRPMDAPPPPLSMGTRRSFACLYKWTTPTAKNPREMDKVEEGRRHLCRIGANKRRTLGHFGIVPPPLPRKRATGKMWNKYILRYLTLGNHHLLASSPSAGNTKILAVSFHKPNSLLMCVFFFSLSLLNYQMGYHQKKIRPGQTALCNNPVDTRPQQKQQPHSHGG